MSDPISAYNASLEAMAAACEEAANESKYSAGMTNWSETYGLACAAAAFIRSQMLRPIEEAPPHMTIIVAVDGALEAGWKSDDGSIVLPPRIRTEPTHFLPLPQIGDRNE